MLNYIWAGLIVGSFIFAGVYDARDLWTDRYRNDTPLPVALEYPEGYTPDRRAVPVVVTVPPDDFAAFYGTESPATGRWNGLLIQSADGRQLRLDPGIELPEPLATIATVSASNEGGLQGRVARFETGDPTRVTLHFEPVHFVKMRAIAQAALDFAATAAEIALGLIGVLALFLGLLRIGEEAGLVRALVRFVRPVLRPLFPGVPEDHPALAMIALNLTANVFGLGNAATPFGLKAMEELQTLNPSDDTATDDMVMLLAVNTASVQLMPPVLLLALMGLQINELIFAIILTTGVSLVIAILAAKFYARLPGWRASNPQQTGEA